MCEIYTFPATTWIAHKPAILKALRYSILMNPDGIAICTPTQTLQLVAVPGEDFALYRNRVINMLRQMHVDTRIWIHLRYATTQHVGVTECHGFHAIDAADNTRYMHNGMIRGAHAACFRVDSFALPYNVTTLEPLLKALERDGTSYANIFEIKDETYTVTRMGGGELCTNKERTMYGTNPIPGLGMNTLVAPYSTATRPH